MKKIERLYLFEQTYGFNSLNFQPNSLILEDQIFYFYFEKEELLESIKNFLNKYNGLDEGFKILKDFSNYDFKSFCFFVESVFYQYGLIKPTDFILTNYKMNEEAFLEKFKDFSKTALEKVSDKLNKSTQALLKLAQNVKDFLKYVFTQIKNGFSKLVDNSRELLEKINSEIIKKTKENLEKVLNELKKEEEEFEKTLKEEVVDLKDEITSVFNYIKKDLVEDLKKGFVNVFKSDSKVVLGESFKSFENFRVSYYEIDSLFLKEFLNNVHFKFYDEILNEDFKEIVLVPFLKKILHKIEETIPFFKNIVKIEEVLSKIFKKPIKDFLNWLSKINNKLFKAPGPHEYDVIPSLISKVLAVQSLHAVFENVGMAFNKLPEILKGISDSVTGGGFFFSFIRLLPGGSMLITIIGLFSYFHLLVELVENLLKT